MATNRSIMEFFGKRPTPKTTDTTTSRPISRSPSTPVSARVPTQSNGISASDMGQNRSKVETKPALPVTPQDAASTKVVDSLDFQPHSQLSPQPRPSSHTSSAHQSRHASPRQSKSRKQNARSEVSPSVDIAESPASADSVKTNGRVIKSSDDEEDDDSDSSLEDLDVLLAARKPTSSASSTVRPKTPPRQPLRNADFHKSPLAVLTKKPRFDMNSLLEHARKDESAEASSKRMKALMSAEEEKKKIAQVVSNGFTAKENLAKSSLLETVVKEKDEGDMAKVTRALMRTEATVTERRFYFFETGRKVAESKVRPFPKGSVSKGWDDLRTAQSREQSFLSGFVEDLVLLGNQLPDEIVSWILEATCLESSEPLRYSYLNVLRQCPDQLHVLLSPAEIQRMFRLVGASKATTTLSDLIVPTAKLTDPYGGQDWSKVCSLLRLLGVAAPSLAKQSCADSICILLRMTADRVVLENVDLLMVEHKTLSSLLKYIPEQDWEAEVRTYHRG